MGSRERTVAVDILKGEKAWSGVEVCLDEAASGQQSVSPRTKSLPC